MRPILPINDCIICIIIIYARQVSDEGILMNDFSLRAK